VDESLVLAIELGEKYGSYAITDRSASTLYQLAYCTVDEWTPESFNDFYKTYPYLSKSFFKTTIGYTFPQAVIVPTEEFHAEASTLILRSYGHLRGDDEIVPESMPGWQMHIIYNLPAGIKDLVTQRFPGAFLRHIYTLQINKLDGGAGTGKLLVDLRNTDFSLIAGKGSRLLFAGTFEYTSPQDVLFHLLKIVEQYSLSRHDLLLQLTGLIDQDSSLYEELHQYFINIEFGNASWGIRESYPAHFFTTLNDLAKCAS
jgi:hypothetical protein